MKTKIGIIGSGVVSQVLADGFIKHGYEVKIGSRDTLKLNEWKNKAGEKGSTGSFAEAANFGEIIVLAAKGTAASEALKLAGETNLHREAVHVRGDVLQGLRLTSKVRAPWGCTRPAQR